MRKRPLALAAVFFIVIEMILSKGLHLFSRSSPFEILTKQSVKIEASVTGTVEKTEDKEKSQCLYLKNVKIIYKNQIYNESKILAYTGRDQQIKTGNKIKSIMELECIEGPRNPGNFNEKKYYKLKGISIRGYGKICKVIDDSENIFSEILYKIRSIWTENIKKALSEKYSGILMAVLTGEKGSIDKNTRNLYSKNGIGHILAISGLHMSFIGMTVYNLFRKCNRSFLTSSIAGTVVLLFYCIITGNSVSAKRAFIMYIVRTGAEITGRTYDMPISICIGLMALITINVNYLEDPGFLLSFGALIGIGVVYPCIKKQLSCLKCKKLIELILPGVCISLVSIPVTLYFFYEYPLYSVILNLIIIPLMSIVMICGVTGSILSLMIPGKFNIVLKLCGVLFFIFEKLCIIFSKLPFWRIVTGKISMTGVIIYYFVLIMFLYFISLENKKISNKKISSLAVIMLVICIHIFTPGFTGISDKISITMVDVGQGDGIYIRDNRGDNYFVDGGSTDIKNPGENRIIPYLLSEGVRTIDYCFITHGDNDHKNGVEEILKDQNNTIKIKRIVVPDKKFWDKGLYELYNAAKEAGVKVLTYNKGTKVNNGKLSIEFMFPFDDYKGPSGNEASMVFKLKYKEFSMLFTGDLEGEGERMVERDPKLGKVNVLKTAHHGSDGSTSNEFLDKTKPQIALISSGIDNIYGHPGKNTLKRLEESGADVYCTNKKGAINVSTDGKRIKVATFLQ